MLVDTLTSINTIIAQFEALRGEIIWINTTKFCLLQAKLLWIGGSVLILTQLYVQSKKRDLLKIGADKFMLALALILISLLCYDLLFQWLNSQVNTIGKYIQHNIEPVFEKAEIDPNRKIIEPIYNSNKNEIHERLDSLIRIDLSKNNKDADSSKLDSLERKLNWYDMGIQKKIKTLEDREVKIKEGILASDTTFMFWEKYFKSQKKGYDIIMRLGCTISTILTIFIVWMVFVFIVIRDLNKNDNKNMFVSFYKTALNKFGIIGIFPLLIATIMNLILIYTFYKV